jgi:hypothetical protein
MPPAASETVPYEGDAPYIFISYSRKDREVVRPILSSLQEKGVRLWWDAGIHAGADWAERLEKRVAACTGLVVFLSPSSTEKKPQNWVLAETRKAASADKEVIPVLLREFPLGLEWAALVEHRQMMRPDSRGHETIVEGVAARAAALGCIGQEDERLPAQPPAPRPTTRTRTKAPAQTITSLEALEKIQSIFDRIAPAYQDWEDEGAETDFDYGDEVDLPPPGSIEFPLAVDHDAKFTRCRELIAVTAELRDPAIPAGDRLRRCLAETASIPGSKHHDSVHVALCLCHLYQLVALVGIHADARVPIDEETMARLDKASRVIEGVEAGTLHRCVCELSGLLDLTLRLVRLELVFMPGIPKIAARDRAKAKGVAAYPPEWRERISKAEALERELWNFHASGEPGEGVVADAFRAAWTFGEWITCCYRDLRCPGVFHPLPSQPIERAPGMQRRGAERAANLRKQIGWQGVPMAAKGLLLSHCYRRKPGRSWGGNFYFEMEATAWLLAAHDAAAEEPPTLADHLGTPNCHLLLADLLERHSSSNLWLYNQRIDRYDRKTLVGRFGEECAKRGQSCDRGWVARAWMSDERMRSFLWGESQDAILADAPFATDILLLAGACDPGRESLARGRRHYHFHGERKERADAIRAAPDSVELQRSGWFPASCYAAHADRATEDIRALFAE